MMQYVNAVPCGRHVDAITPDTAVCVALHCGAVEYSIEVYFFCLSAPEKEYRPRRRRSAPYDARHSIGLRCD